MTQTEKLKNGRGSAGALRVLGITGHVGSGKSTILAHLEQAWQARILELDKAAAYLQRKGGPCYGPMLELLEDRGNCLREDGEFDRKQVAELVFSDPALLEAINRIVHPAVKDYVRQVITETQAGLIVIEAALLFEGHYEQICDEIWYVFTQESVRARRLKESRGYSDEKIASILRAQASDDYFRSRADAVIDNSGDDPRITYRLVDAQMERFMAS